MTRLLLPLFFAPLLAFSQQQTSSVSSPLLFNNSWQTGLPITPTEVNYWTGQGATLGKYIFPHVHLNGVVGSSSSEQVEELSSGHHDPKVDGFTLQGFEFGTSVRAGDFEAFGNLHLGYDPNAEEWEHEFEEAFLKWKNLGNFELRGGRYYQRFGLQNTLHLHGWDWADQYLVSGRFLGEDGLSSLGGEVNYYLPVRWTSLLTFSAGQVPEHEHHHDEEEEHEEGHAYEPEGAHFADTLLSANWTNVAYYNDFHQFRFGMSGAWGENEFGSRNRLLGAHLEYQWREDGFATTGSYLRWRTEAMWRRVGAVAAHHGEEEEEAGHDHEEHHEEQHAAERATFSEFGMYSDLRYGWAADGLQLGLRVEHVTGIAELDLPQRTRISPAVSYFFNPMRTLFFRVQYNYDMLPSSQQEHSVWAQFGFNWGGPEVR